MKFGWWCKLTLLSSFKFANLVQLFAPLLPFSLLEDGCQVEMKLYDSTIGKFHPFQISATFQVPGRKLSAAGG